MRTTRRAVIDVGTNSVKVLLADVSGETEITPVWEESHQTRLGAGLYETMRLNPERIEATASSVADFAQRARELGAMDVRVFATSAARESLNRMELVAAIQQRSGLLAEVIPGPREAELGFRGVTSDSRFSGRSLLVMDAGGGSTQLILGQGRELTIAQSLPVGSVRLIENHPPGDPPQPSALVKIHEAIQRVLREQVAPLLHQRLSATPAAERRGAGAVQLVGVGGTATIVACMEAQLTRFDRAALEAVCITRDRLLWHRNRLWGMDLSRRRQLPGLPANRADVILAGSAIFYAAMDYFGLESLQVSSRGIRFGMLRAG